MIPFIQAAHGNDWGGYDYDALQVENLRKLGGSDIFIIQYGGGGSEKLIRRAQADGQLTGLYAWQNALETVQGQADNFSRAIEQLNPDAIILDYEHWWKVWAEYWAAIGGKLPWDQVQKLPAEKISESGRLTAELIRQRWAGKYILVYTAKWFTSGYAPASSAWLRDYNLFVATYPDYGVKPYSCSWEQIRAGYLKALNRDGTVRDDNVASFTPDLPAGLTSWDAWQFSSRRIYPGESYAVDWIVFNMTPAQLLAKCGKGPEVEPEWKIEIRGRGERPEVRVG